MEPNREINGTKQSPDIHVNIQCGMWVTFLISVENLTNGIVIAWLAIWEKKKASYNRSLYQTSMDKVL